MSKETYERTEMVITEFVVEDVLTGSAPPPRRSIYEFLITNQDNNDVV